MEIVKNIAFEISRALQGRKTPEEISALLETPKNPEHGDLAFPCFLLAKELRKAPQAIAAELAQTLGELPERTPLLERAESVGPYVNIVLDKGCIAGALLPNVLNGSFLASTKGTGERVMVEYSQPNTHKAFHVGHIRSAVLGDTVARLLAWSGNDVVPVNYLGDEGTHVARCLWYLLRRYEGEIPEENRGEFLGLLYTKATDLLDLATYTAAPFPGVVAAQVIERTEHPSNKDWQVVRVRIPEGEKTVVCGAKGFTEGDLVAYALPNTHVGDKLVGIVERGNVRSEGMICSEQEIGVSTANDEAALLPAGTPIGTEVVEIFRIPGAVPEGTSVKEHHASLLAEVSEILQRIEGGDPEITKLWNETKQWSIEEFHEVYDWLKCRFDHYFFESECGEPSKKLVREFLERGVFEESDGAIGANLREYGLGFCLLIKRDGTALYATRDLALAKMKFEEFNVSRSIYVVDSGQKLHFQQVFKCLELMGYPQAEKCFHLDFAQVVRPDGKMSSRKGNVILFSELKQRLIEKITREFLEKYREEWPDAEIEEAAYRIALATMRYGMLNQDNHSKIVFDLDEWTARSGNTGPYLMYAYARIRSILRELGELEADQADWNLLQHPSEADVLMHVQQYRDTVQRAADQLSPHLLCAYLYELSKKFSRMYQDCPVIRAESPELRTARALLVKSAGEVLRAGLALLGIETIERM